MTRRIRFIVVVLLAGIIAIGVSQGRARCRMWSETSPFVGIAGRTLLIYVIVLAVLEIDGTISVLKQEDTPTMPRQRHRVRFMRS